MGKGKLGDLCVMYVAGDGWNNIDSKRKVLMYIVLCVSLTTLIELVNDKDV